MVKIEHIAMYVNDLEAARDFFVKYLGGTSNDGYHNKNTDFEQMFLEKNGSLFCKELIARRAGTGRTCNDIVGEAAAMLDSLL